MGLDLTAPVQIYTVVEAKSVNDLVRLTNMKTKQGWFCLGGICNTPANYCESDTSPYPYCQSMYRMEKPKKERAVKEFVAFPYEGKKSITPQDLPRVPSRVIIKKTPPVKKNKNYATRHANKNK
jgi:hypothetical protein